MLVDFAVQKHVLLNVLNYHFILNEYIYNEYKNERYMKSSSMVLFIKRLKAIPRNLPSRINVK
jgi:hypothetical protein